MTKEEIEGVGFEYCDCAEMMQVVCGKVLGGGNGGNDVTMMLDDAQPWFKSAHTVEFQIQRYDKDVLVDGMNTMPGENA